MFIKLTLKEDKSSYVAFEVLGKKSEDRYTIRILSTSESSDFTANQLLTFNPINETNGDVVIEILDEATMKILYSDVASQRQSLPPEEKDEIKLKLGL